MKTLEIRWPTVALVAAVVAGIVAVFAFAGPDERSDLLGILAVLGTTAAAVMRAAFGAEAPKPKRIEPRCEECWMMPWRGHMETCSKYTGNAPTPKPNPPLPFTLPLASAPPDVDDRISARVDIDDEWSDAVVTKVHAVAEKSWGAGMPSTPAETIVTAKLSDGRSVCAPWPSPLLAKNGAPVNDDDPGTGGEVLADGPPTVPQRVSSRRNTLLSVPTGLCLALLVGCSPSALQTHATIALVASHTLEVTRVSALATCAALRDTCAVDAACVEHTRADCLAVADAQDATVAAVAVYVDAVELAVLADEGRVMEALRFTLEAVERAWVSFGERLALVGISLPALGGVQ